jgi:dihydroorotate dehydrogenase
MRVALRADPGGGVDLLGMHFPSRLGMAAGFDKDARVLWALWGLGFGFVEVGSVTARPWAGNPRPRVHRLPLDRAIINRMGLPSTGVEAVLPRLATRPPFPVLINVAKTGDPSIQGDRAVEDMRATVQAVRPGAGAVVLNLSCPNTEDGRTFEDPRALRDLLQACMATPGTAPILVKVSPDLSPAGLEMLAQIALMAGAAGFVATNTSKARDGLKTRFPGGFPAGGLSGAPLLQRSVDTVRRLRAQAGPGVALIGCGGVMSVGDAQAFLEAGADLVEAYTGFIYEGPLFPSRVNRALVRKALPAPR